ncbi:hypothetical protein ACU61A_42365 [Pseudonocardia sichuanensis]
MSLALIAAWLLLVAGCASDERAAVAASAGCRGVLVELVEHNGGIAVAVSAQDCVERDGARASRQEAIDRLAEAVWRTAWSSLSTSAEN